MAIRYRLQYFGGRGASGLGGGGGNFSTYKNYDIERFGDQYSVLYQGDEVIVDSLKDAKKFIDDARVYEVYDEISNGAGSLKEIANYSDDMDIKAAKFTENGNSVKAQRAILDNGTQRVDLWFSSEYNPQVNTGGSPKKAIETSITARVWENDNFKGTRTLTKTKSKSYKNAEKQYNEMLNEWKKVTGQKKITFS